jgi:FAD/FMN-containing dehydrogenase
MLNTLEGDIYRKMDALITQNTDEIERARPTVSKNSAGYALWRIKEKGLFNLSQLIVGAQGTLALITKAHLRLIQPKKHKSMLVVFLKDLNQLPEIVKRVLKHEPESFESYDSHTFSLAVQFLPQMLGQMGLSKMIRLGFAFLPEVWTVLTSGVPKMVLMAEFAEDTATLAKDKTRMALRSLDGLSVRARLAGDALQSEKYWIVRRESFALLRKNLKGMYAAPFIDDFVVHPDDYPAFLPELDAILSEYSLTYTIAGHIGNGNFHIIPLMDLSNPESRKIINELSPKVYELVTKYKGSITGEHNDGIIRTPYLEMMFGKKMIELFAETKRIFDPLNILNPGKKVAGSFEDIDKYMVHK